MKDLNVINCTAYSNGVNSPLEYLNITTPAEFKVVMDLLCYYDSKKTYSKSNKLKKRIKNSPENMKIFLNTHEAIIDRATFDLVQKHFEGRKRADKHGVLDKYAGFLYCAECGSRMYRNRDKAHGYDSYRCGHYESRKSDCTSHYIRESVLDEIVLRAMKKVTKYAREHSDEFYKDAMRNGKAEAAKNLKESGKP